MDTMGYSSPQLLPYEVPYLLKCKMKFLLKFGGLICEVLNLHVKP